MPVVERSVIVPLSLEEAWEAFFGDDMQNWVRLSDAVAEVRDYRMRDDGTPEYVMVNRMGPMRALFPLLRPIFVRGFQRDLDTMAARIRASNGQHH